LAHQEQSLRVYEKNWGGLRQRVRGEEENGFWKKGNVRSAIRGGTKGDGGVGEIVLTRPLNLGTITTAKTSGGHNRGGTL